MATYCTTTSLETLWGGTTFSGLTALASECIDQAEGETNKYLSQRYDISSATFQTSTSIPVAVQNIAKWYAVGYLYEATARGSKDAYARADRYIKKARQNLMDIIEYKANLIDSSGDEISDNSTQMQILSSTDGYSSTFNEDDPLDWAVDSTKLSDISDDRS